MDKEGMLRLLAALSTRRGFGSASRRGRARGWARQRWRRRRQRTERGQHQLYDTLRHNTATPGETKVRAGAQVEVGLAWGASGKGKTCLRPPEVEVTGVAMGRLSEPREVGEEAYSDRMSP